MFKEMRRIEKQLSKDKVEEILNKGEYGMLSTIGENGYPYGVPVNYVYMKDSIYIHGAVEGHKIDNINFNPKTSFCVVNYSEVIPNKFSTHYESVIVFGRAEVIEGEEKELALEGFIHKYSKEFLEPGKKYISGSKNRTKIIKMKIEHMTGKKGS
jgi:nitroimidazol reductase NimA-like FMN-containing flavoprotein (pyridoxamine 5'-phosphate oxidase superfamily)